MGRRRALINHVLVDCSDQPILSLTTQADPRRNRPDTEIEFQLAALGEIQNRIGDYATGIQLRDGWLRATADRAR